MYENMKTAFSSQFAHEATHLFSAPGRTEISGNHTDHQHGCVLAAAVDMETVAAVALNGSDIIRIQSEGYPLCQIDLKDLSVLDSEKNSTASLIRGVAARFVQMGAQVKGFDAYMTSTVLPGSGLSSSAAFEVLVGTIINHLFYEAKARLESDVRRENVEWNNEELRKKKDPDAYRRWRVQQLLVVKLPLQIAIHANCNALSHSA